MAKETFDQVSSVMWGQNGLDYQKNYVMTRSSWNDFEIRGEALYYEGLVYGLRLGASQKPSQPPIFRGIPALSSNRSYVPTGYDPGLAMCSNYMMSAPTESRPLHTTPEPQPDSRPGVAPSSCATPGMALGLDSPQYTSDNTPWSSSRNDTNYASYQGLFNYSDWKDVDMAPLTSQPILPMAAPMADLQQDQERQRQQYQTLQQMQRQRMQQQQVQQQLAKSSGVPKLSPQQYSDFQATNQARQQYYEMLNQQKQTATAQQQHPLFETSISDARCRAMLSTRYGKDTKPWTSVAQTHTGLPIRNTTATYMTNYNANAQQTANPTAAQAQVPGLAEKPGEPTASNGKAPSTPPIDNQASHQPAESYFHHWTSQSPAAGHEEDNALTTTVEDASEDSFDEDYDRLDSPSTLKQSTYDGDPTSSMENWFDEEGARDVSEKAEKWW